MKVVPYWIVAAVPCTESGCSRHAPLPEGGREGGKVEMCGPLGKRHFAPSPDALVTLAQKAAKLECLLE